MDIGLIKFHNDISKYIANITSAFFLVIIASARRSSISVSGYAFSNGLYAFYPATFLKPSIYFAKFTVFYKKYFFHCISPFCSIK